MYSNKNRRRRAVLLPVAIVCLILLALLLTARRPSDDRACLDMLKAAGWTVASREDSGMGYGEMTGAEFLSGAVGDPVFAQYVTELQGIPISPDDVLKGYEYTLGEYCFERRFKAYFLERNGEIVCCAVWAAESYSSHAPGSFYPLDTDLEVIRGRVAAEIRAYGFPVPEIRSEDGTA